MSIFISSQSVDSAHAASLIDGLRRARMGVEYSPRNPRDGEDPRWVGWYEAGLAAALGRCCLFVAVIDHVWDSSTWMACEADMATRRGLSLLYWNPQGVAVKAKGMLAYLREELPARFEEALGVLCERDAPHSGHCLL
jgi:hypothetical protein